MSRPEPALREAVAASVARARAHGCAQFVAYRERVAARDCLDVFAASREPERFYWERRERGRALVGLGVAAAIEADGAKRFDDSDRAARALFATLAVAGEAAPTHAGPLLLGGFAFAARPAREPLWRDFPAARFSLPALTLVRDRDDCWCTLVRAVSARDDVAVVAAQLADEMARWHAADVFTPQTAMPAIQRGTHREVDEAAEFRLRGDHAQRSYLEKVAEALAGIRAGDFEKVVLARGLRLECAAAIDSARVLEALRGAYPSCTTFAIARGPATFLGATPEQLVRLDADRVETAAVAGSAPRSGDPGADDREGRLLLEDKKEQVEHAIVVRALREVLEGCCDQLDIPEAPRLLRVAEIQHLETPIRGRLRADLSVIDLVGRLHPTPAVGGAPRAAATRFIADREDLDRGWYSGPIGFVDAALGGEFCVALRSAVVRDRTARLYAGAGIVDGSVPAAELRETRLKFHAMLQPLLEV